MKYCPPQTPLDIVYLDEHLLVVNKPSGLLSVPGRGEERTDCLITRVQQEVPDALTVHRLDMETSGLLLIARGKEIHRQLSIAFMQREVDKRYVAIVAGQLAPASGEVNLPIIVDWPNRPLQKVDHETGRPSLTRYSLLSYDQEKQQSRVALEPVTGRSHQLRLHMKTIGHPMLGDDLYAPPDVLAAAPRLLLHAEFLRFCHPVTGRVMECYRRAEF